MTKSPVESAREFAEKLSEAGLDLTSNAITDLIEYAESLEQENNELKYYAYGKWGLLPLDKYKEHFPLFEHEVDSWLEESAGE